MYMQRASKQIVGRIFRVTVFFLIYPVFLRFIMGALEGILSVLQLELLAVEISPILSHPRSRCTHIWAQIRQNGSLWDLYVVLLGSYIDFQNQFKNCNNKWEESQSLVHNLSEHNTS